MAIRSIPGQIATHKETFGLKKLGVKDNNPQLLIMPILDFEFWIKEEI